MAKKEFFWHLSISKVLRLIIIQFIFLCLYSENRKESCMESERAALLTFKAGLNDRRNILSSWQGEDCCRWRGVACNNKTGHVVGLNLRSSNDNTDSWLGDLSGEFSPSLLTLKHLRRLDLSLNNFTGSPIPEFIGSFENLRYLNLSGAGFTGQVPPQLGNLSRLLYLDLHDLYLSNFSLSLHADNLRWLQHLSSLKYLDLTLVNLTAAVDWLHMVNMLPSLTFLKLEDCSLHFIPSHLPHINFTALNTLDLEGNKFNSTLPPWLGNISSLTNLNLGFTSFYGPIPDTIGNLICLEVLNLEDNDFNSTLPQWLGNISSLTSLNLGGNSFHGMIPSTIQNLCNLNTLDLSENKFSGEIDDLVERLPNCTQRRLQILRLSSNKFSGKLTKGLEQMVNLDTLDLSNNQLEGHVPAEVGKLQQLTYLDLSSNSFKGVVTEAHFANLTRLKWLVLSNNSLIISLDESWAPPFQLERLGLGSCLVGALFPAWLQHQKKVSMLDLSSSGISGTVPEWFWNYFPPFIEFLDLSNNQISGKLPEFLEFAEFPVISLASNLFEGPLPLSWPNHITILDLSNNSFSGPLPSIESPYLHVVDLSSNHFNSNMPSSWSKASTLLYLDLSDNNFSGEIPNEWPTDIEFINLGGNHLSGRIPTSLGSLTRLQTLGLSNNSLSGMFPASLRTCKVLSFLDLSQNKFYGNIPTWLGESFPELAYLLLRSNMLSGSIPARLMLLPYLQILDLAENNLSGAIPYHLGNLGSMASTTEHSEPTVFDLSSVELRTFRVDYYDSFFVFTKGEKLKYTKTGYLVKSIDLSDNHLKGEIPDEIGDLIGLMNLNLSSNQLEGKIPEKISRLQSLESLDLSRNELSGNIPLGLSSLSSLSHLNLSYNHLSGNIPSGNQLQTLNDPSIYAGNVDLCGHPLSKNCSSNNTNGEGNGGYEDNDGDEMVWLYLGMGLGYVVGFWAACGVLLFKKTWRYAYFRFFDNIYDQLYVVVFLTLNKLKRATMDRN